jgi:hypothetical protein
MSIEKEPGQIAGEEDIEDDEEAIESEVDILKR